MGCAHRAKRFAGSLDEALAIARSIGYPVAMKVVSAALPHKAAVGGVALDLGATMSLPNGGLRWSGRWRRDSRPASRSAC